MIFDRLDTPLPLPARRPFTYAPPDVPLAVIYEDADLIAIDKPAGLLSVPGRDAPDCAESRVREICPEALTIHRLDLATSGVLLFAKNPNAQRHVGLQFEKRMTEKSYIADVFGRVAPDHGTVDLPIITDWPNRPAQMICHERGREAVTAFKVLNRTVDRTRLALFPKTGRSHQLRIHCLALGHPILGDMIYAPDAAYQAADRLHLHAELLRLRKPTGGDWITIDADCPF